MTDTDLLLPSAETPLTRELSRRSEVLDAIDCTPLETIWNADTCPPVLLPWLAWALSVDVWEQDWSETKKRKAIADSPAYHRLKGTRASVDLIALQLGCRMAVREWWQQAPPGRRGTFEIIAYVAEGRADEPILITPEHIARWRSALAVTKPKARAYRLRAGIGFSGAGDLSAASGHVDFIDVPQPLPIHKSAGAQCLATVAAAHADYADISTAVAIGKSALTTPGIAAAAVHHEFIQVG